MSEKQKEIVLRFHEEIWNLGNFSVFDELVAPSFVNNNPLPGFPNDREGLKKFIRTYRAAFPDVHMHPDLLFTDGDLVAIRFTAHGTHSGEFMGVPATGKKFQVTGIVINRLADGHIVEGWSEFDQAGMLVQLGLAKPPIPA